MSLYEEEKLDGAVAEAHMLAALEYSYAANTLLAQKYASLAFESNLIWRGPRDERTELMERMMEEPEETVNWNWTAKMGNFGF